MLSIMSENHGSREVMVVRAHSWWAYCLLHSGSRINRKWGSAQTPQDSSSRDLLPSARLHPREVPQHSKTAPLAGFRMFKQVSLWGLFHIQTTVDNYDVFCYIMIDLTCFLHNSTLSIGTVLIADFCLPTESSTLRTIPSTEEAVPEMAK